MHYNPFAYIRSEKDILKLVTTLMKNTQGEQKGGDEFWTKAETLLYTALIGYIWYEAPKEEQNFNTLIEFINASEVREDDEDFKNPVDLMFDKLEEKSSQHFAVRQYKKYKLAAGDINCNSNLNQLQTRIATIMAERKCYLWTILENGYAKSVLVGIFYPKKNKTSTSLVGMTKCVTERRTHLENANYCTV